MMLPGIDENVVNLLSELRIKGNVKGEAILTMDPERGPFTELEIQAIHHSLSDRYKSGGITCSDYCLAWLFISIGMRPTQYADMKIIDILASNEQDGSEILIARVPEAKKRVLRRELFLERKISGLMGHIFSVKELLGEKIEDINEAPLFPDLSTKKNSKGFKYHASPQKIGRTIKRVINSLRIISERTGKELFVNATRFRRTLGTRAAEEGLPPLLIAEILGHKDTQNVGVYIEATPAIIKRIDNAVAMKLAPMAQAFKGILISSGSDAVRGDDKSSRICSPQQVGDFRPVGSCGLFGFCGSFAPIACYTCQNFQPWVDAPHEKVLEYLISERERLLGSSDARIAAINDQTILAVAQVVTMCKKQLAHENG
ncbi:site-specific integrase [Polynucleobacter sp. JS-Safj-400b-B2]|nr:site-specific integrase [Polynucleobacter sp. JS-Safj-400b-B2]